jgi:hypothetical protein
VDVFTGRAIARDAAEIEVVLEPRSSALYAIGDPASGGGR